MLGPSPSPVIFFLDGVRGRAATLLGMGPTRPAKQPLPTAMLFISGVTKDSTGAVLGSCTVKLYRTSDDALLQSATSDASTGAYSFGGVAQSFAYYVVAYKAGSPDVAGTTVNTLVGA